MGDFVASEYCRAKREGNATLQRRRERCAGERHGAYSKGVSALQLARRGCAVLAGSCGRGLPGGLCCILDAGCQGLARGCRTSLGTRGCCAVLLARCKGLPRGCCAGLGTRACCASLLARRQGLSRSCILDPGCCSLAWGCRNVPCARRCGLARGICCSLCAG